MASTLEAPKPDLAAVKQRQQRMCRRVRLGESRQCAFALEQLHTPTIDTAPTAHPSIGG